MRPILQTIHSISFSSMMIYEHECVIYIYVQCVYDTNNMEI